LHRWDELNAFFKKSGYLPLTSFPQAHKVHSRWT
jgi:hypothetical protein